MVEGPHLPTVRHDSVVNVKNGASLYDDFNANTGFKEQARCQDGT